MITDREPIISDTFLGTGDLTSIFKYSVRTGRKVKVACYAKPSCDPTHCGGNTVVDECECVDLAGECVVCVSGFVKVHTFA